MRVVAGMAHGSHIESCGRTVAAQTTCPTSIGSGDSKVDTRWKLSTGKVEGLDLVIDSNAGVP